jgi:hypothetical protein
MTERKPPDAINVKIPQVKAQATAGPPSTSMPLDVERVVADWSAGH